MNNLSKTLLRVAAILPVIALCLRKVDQLCWQNDPNIYQLWADAIGSIVIVSELISLAAACFIIYHQRNAMPQPDKRFRVVTHIAAICMLVAVIWGLTQLRGWGEYNYWLYNPYWLRFIWVAVLSTWLWMFSNRMGEEQLSKPMTTLVLCGGIITAFAFFIMLTAGTIVLKTGHVFGTGLHSGLYCNWVCMLVPAILLSTYAFSITSKQVKERILTTIVWVLFSASILTIICHGLLNHLNTSSNYLERNTVQIAPVTQNYVQEEMDSLVKRTSPKWASAIVMDVSSGVVMATYSSDSVEHYKDTIHLGTLVIPEILGEALQYSSLERDAKVTIHKEGITIDTLRFYDSHPRDTVLDIPGVIATSSMVGAATMLEPLGIEWVNLLRKASRTTMLDEANLFCFLIDDQNRYIHNRDKQVILKGMHEVVWNNNIGTASVRQWMGHIVDYKAQSESIHIAGKTGSAQIYRDGVYHSNEHRISFIGYFPEEAPRYCCLVVIDTPNNYPMYDAGYDCGGTVRRIAERIYKH